MDIGSSFLPSDIIAAFLFAQLENIDAIQQKRKQIWERYYHGLLPLMEKYGLRLPEIAENATNNGHMFYLVTKQIEEREALIAHLKQKEIHAVFHYLSLHKSPFYEAKHDGRILSNSDFFADGLLRLPMYFELTMEQVDSIANQIKIFYSNR